MGRLAVSSLIAVFIVLIVIAEVYTFQKCGFTKTMFYGKSAFWAAIGGYCDD